VIVRLLSAALFLFPLVAAGATGGGHGGHEAHGIPWPTLFFSTVNLLIFLFVLKRVAWPGIVRWVADRRQRVVDELEKAADATRKAEALRKEWETRLSTLSSEIEEMRRQAREEIARERDAILAAAKTAAERIRSDAERAAAQEVRQAQETLRHEAARQALAIARELAGQRLTVADQSRFVSDFLGKLNA